MKTISVTIVSLLVLMGVVVSPSLADQIASNDQVAPRTFSGTIDGVDPMQRLVTVQSEKKDTWMLIAVADGAVLKGLRKGDRVVVELDEQGMARKIVKAMPDLHDDPGIKKN
jgi:Cu/Ag efflux protein CusF